MPLVNQLLPGEPILISRIVEPFNIEKDVPASLAQIQDILSKMSGQLYIISDCSNINPNFSEVVTGLAETSRPESPLRNPRTETYVVATGQIFQNMVDWYRQRQYGELSMRLYKTVDEALKVVRADIAKSK
jgi:hypothetical protein